MKKTLPNTLISSAKSLLNHRKQQQNSFCQYIILCLLLTLLQQLAIAQTTPNDNSADWLWTKQAGGPAADRASSVTTDAAGNIYTVGTFTGTAAFGDKSLTSTGDTDIFVSKHDTTGNLIWVKRAGGAGSDQANKIATDAAGNIYVAGTFTGNTTFGNTSLISKGEEDIFVVKYNSTGDVVWAKGEGNAGNNRVTGFKVTASGQVYVSGSFRGSIVIGNNNLTIDADNTESTFIAKYDNAGRVQWAQDAGGFATSVTFDAAGNTYATGTFFNTVVFGSITLTEKSGETDFFTVKYNADGNAVWAKQAVSEAPGSAGLIKTDAAGNVYITGYYDFVSVQFESTIIGGGDFSNAFLAKYDAAGNFLWVVLVANAEFHLDIVDILPDTAGNIYVVYDFQGGGRPSGDFPEIRVILQKYDSSGNLLIYTGIYSDEFSQNQYDASVRATNIIIDAVGRVYLSFSFRGTATLGNGIILTSDNESNIFTAIYDVDRTVLSAQMLEVADLIENGNNTYLAGSFKGVTTFGDTTLTSKGDTDAFVAKLTYADPNLSQRQTITFSAIPKKTFGGTSFPLVASSSSGLPVTFSIVSGPATIEGSMITVTGIGTVTVKASQAGNAMYEAAADVIQTFAVEAATAGVTKEWDKSYSCNRGGGWESSTLLATADGGYLLSGDCFEDNTDLWITTGTVIKTDAAGNRVWATDISINLQDYLWAAVATPDGGYLVGGATRTIEQDEENGNIQTGDFDYWVVKLDGNGKELWRKFFKGPGEDYLTEMVATTDGNFLLGGYSDSGIGGDKTQASKGKSDYWLIKIDANGGKLWDKTFGGSNNDRLTSLISIDDGSFLLGGTSDSGISGDKSQVSRGQNDYWVVKIAADGTKIWDKAFGGANADGLSAMLATTDGGYLLGGSSYSGISGDKSEDNRGGLDEFGNQTSDYWLVKIDGSGNKIYDKRFGGNSDDHLADLLATADGGYLLGGTSISGVSGDKSEGSNGWPFYDYWLIKIKEEPISPPVAPAWNLRYGGSNIDRFTVVIQTQDGGYLSGGYSNSPVSGDKSQNSQGGADYWIVKTDVHGKQQWDKRYGGPDHDYLNRIIPTQDGGYLLAGSSISGVGGDKSQSSRGNQDYWLVKITSSGEKEWDQTYGGSDFDDLRKVNQLSNGDYLLAGTSSSPVSGEKSQSSQGRSDYWIIRVSSTGDKIWDKRYGGSSNESLESFTKTRDGGFLLAGSSASGISGDKTQESQGGRDYWLVKTDAAGNIVYDQRFGGSGDEEFRYIQRTQDGGVLLGGRSDSGVSGDRTQPNQGSTDYWLVKVAPVNQAQTTVAVARLAAQAAPAASLTLAAYPNPTAGQPVTVTFSVPQTQPVNLQVYDSQGRTVASLFQAEAQAGQQYQTTWPAKKQAAGMYILRLQTANKVSTHKLILTR